MGHIFLSTAFSSFSSTSSFLILSDGVTSYPESTKRFFSKVSTIVFRFLCSTSVCTSFSLKTSTIHLHDRILMLDFSISVDRVISWPAALSFFSSSRAHALRGLCASIFEVTYSIEHIDSCRLVCKISRRTSFLPFNASISISSMLLPLVGADVDATVSRFLSALPGHQLESASCQC
jgi:hypothetical protein